MRGLLAVLHRWVALVLGLWFALLGLTGSAIVWHDALDAWLNPQWFAARPVCADAVAQPVARALAVFAHAVPDARAAVVSAPQRPGAATVIWEAPAADGTRRQHFVDVGCGRYLGARDRGALRLDRAHAVPALYELHRALLAGETGHVLVGLGGLVLLGLALSGLALAWPRGAQAAGWWRALTIKRGAAVPRLVYDLHRAVGLWLLPFLLLMGVSGAYLCFPKQGRTLVAALLPTLEGGLERVAAPAMAPDGASGPDALVALAEAQWPAAQWSRLQLPDGGSPLVEVRLLQPGEPRADTGDTRVRLTFQGQVIARRDALQAPAGETLLGWQFPLHSGEALGPLGRGAWTLFGLAPALLFASSAWLWWRRRRQQGRRAAAPMSPRAPKE